MRESGPDRDLGLMGDGARLSEEPRPSWCTTNRRAACIIGVREYDGGDPRGAAGCWPGACVRLYRVARTCPGQSGLFAAALRVACIKKHSCLSFYGAFDNPS